MRWGGCVFLPPKRRIPPRRAEFTEIEYAAWGKGNAVSAVTEVQGLRDIGARECRTGGCPGGGGASMAAIRLVRAPGAMTALAERVGRERLRPRRHGEIARHARHLDQPPRTVDLRESPCSLLSHGIGPGGSIGEGCRVANSARQTLKHRSNSAESGCDFWRRGRTLFPTPTR